MEQAYAQALWQLIENGMAPKKALDSLIESLKAKGRQALLPRIATAFQRLAEREMRKNTVTVSVASEKDASAAQHKAKKLLESMQLETRDLEVELDSSLIGGWRVEGAGVMVDESFKKKLLDMYNAATR